MTFPDGISAEDAEQIYLLYAQNYGVDYIATMLGIRREHIHMAIDQHLRRARAK